MTATAADFRIDHAMIRVLDLDKSLDFYTRILGMKLLRKSDYPGGRFTNAFVGYSDDRDTYPALELTHNWDQEEAYDRGNGWGHIALKVPDIYAAAARLKSHGVEFTKEPSPMKHGTRVIAFIKDPDATPLNSSARSNGAQLARPRSPARLTQPRGRCIFPDFLRFSFTNRKRIFP